METIRKIISYHLLQCLPSTYLNNLNIYNKLYIFLRDSKKESPYKSQWQKDL